MKYIFLLMSMLLGIVSIGRTETSVSFEPNTVSLGESAQLIFSSDQPFNQLPDLSGLKNDFAVAGQQQRTQIISINGQRQTLYELILNVFPRKSGRISTGELTFDGKRLNPATITVLNQGEKESLPIFLQADTSSKEVYPDETFLYTIRLTDGVGLSAGQINPPAVQNARIIPLNMDKTWQDADKNGKPVRVFERSFAITPEKDGYLTISPAELYGSIITSSANRSADLFAQGMLFDGFTSSQKDIRLESNPIQIKVLKKPKKWKGWWLPSAQVKLSADDTLPETVTVGDSLSRTIRLTAMGVEAERLPVIVQPENNQLKIYPSPEQRNTVQSPKGDIQGTEELSLIIVPQVSGDISIPEIRIPWFNTKTREREEAVIPAKKITVKPSETTNVPIAQPVQEEDTPIPERIHAKKDTRSPQPESKKDNQSEWKTSWILSFIGFGIIVGFGLGFVFFRRKKHHKKSYRLPTEAEIKPKKKKKPLPDLYPF